MFRPAVSIFIMLLFCLATLSGCSDRSLDARYYELPFDETQWKAEISIWIKNPDPRNLSEEIKVKMSEDVYRARMIGDLVENHLRPGMTKEEIEMLLGPHESRTAEGDGWVYYLAIKGFEDIKGPSGSHNLIIWFTESGKYYMGYNVVLD
ncbi:MAG: outer membrane protein assembly factor BamE [Planctomycetaceae bacterium]|nr:outer membrane protein assembly factor BamE [Planctomycetaceae bacterium]